MAPFKVVDEESDGEEEEEQSGMTSNGCCSFLKPRRSMSGRLSASGAPFSRLSTEEDPPAKLQRSRSVCGSIFFCCREEDRTTTTTVEVRAGDNTKWQVDVNEEELYVKPPYWKQVVRKVRSQYRRPCARVSAKSMNYDVHSYQMNFDDGLQHCSSFLYADGKDDATSRARAMHQALCKKMAAGRAM